MAGLIVSSEKATEMITADGNIKAVLVVGPELSCYCGAIREALPMPVFDEWTLLRHPIAAYSALARRTSTSRYASRYTSHRPSHFTSR